MLKIACQMDEIAKCNPKTDSSLALIEEAHFRGHQVFYFTPKDLFLDDGCPKAFCQLITQTKHYDDLDNKPKSLLGLKELDVLLIRQDPPFDMSYITNTLILDFLKKDVLVINNPAGIRNAAEKIFLLQFQHLHISPKTLISQDFRLLEEFYISLGDVVLKPLYGCGGEGVLLVEKNDRARFSKECKKLLKNKLPIIAQAYCPAVQKGDKRILLLDGIPVACLNRLPPPNQLHANLHMGGTPQIAKLTQQDKRLCKIIAPALQEEGVLFAGLDVIGGLLTEINTTSPTCVREVKALTKIDVAALFWDMVERKCQKNTKS